MAEAEAAAKHAHVAVAVVAEATVATTGEASTPDTGERAKGLCGPLAFLPARTLRKAPALARRK